MQTSSSSSTSRATSSTSMYNMPNNRFAFSGLISASSDVLSNSNNTVLPHSFVFPSIPPSVGLQYGPPRAPLDDFIDIDVYSVHLSDDEEEQTPQNAINCLQTSSFDLPSGFIPQIQSHVSVNMNNPSSSSHTWIPSSSTQNAFPSPRNYDGSNSQLQSSSDFFPSSTSLEMMSPPQNMLITDEMDTNEMQPSHTNSQSSLPSTDDGALSISSPPPLTSSEGLESTNSSFKKEEISLMPITDIASGNSMTSTLVNLLRGLNLLDWCTLEDLCDYLPTRKHKCSPPTVLAGQPTEKQPSQSEASVMSVAKTKSASLPSRIDSSIATTSNMKSVGHNGGKLVDYLLICSHLGSSAISDFLPPPPCVFFSTTNTSDGSTARNYENVARLPCASSTRCQILPSDWRRGRSDGFVCVVSEGDCYHGDECFLSSPRTFFKPPLSRLIMGKFLPGSNWTSVWPSQSEHSSSCYPSMESRLIGWITSWLRAGAIPFLAQLDNSSPLNGSTSGCGDFFGELNWRHRLVFGVSGNNLVHLSNPLEVVLASTVLKELARLTLLSIAKTDLMQFWHRGCGVDDADKSQPDDDLSLLATQKDPRWINLNILGQVISTLRDFDEAERQRVAAVDNGHHNQHHHYMQEGTGRQITSSSQQDEVMLYSSDPFLVIPSSQQAGFSLFALRRYPSTTTKNNSRMNQAVETVFF